MWESICLTLLATAGNNIGKVLQKKGTIILPPLSFKLKVIRAYLFNKPWAIGFFMDIFGALLMLRALSQAPVSVIQPVSGCGLAVLCVFSHFYLKEVMNAIDWMGIVLAGVGTIGVGVGGEEQKSVAVSIFHLPLLLVIVFILFVGTHFFDQNLRITFLWAADQSLASLYPRLFNVCNKKGGLVEEFWDARLQSWNLHMRRALTDDETTEVAECLNVLNYRRVGQEDDTLIWNCNTSKVFTTKSLYKELTLTRTTGQAEPHFHWNRIWKPQIPAKFKVLLWLVLQNRIPTRDLLIRRGMDVPNNCVCCSNGMESINHVFLDGPLALEVWNYFTSNTNPGWNEGNSMKEMLRRWWDVRWVKKESKKLWNLLPLAVIWVLWNTRNDRIFRDRWTRTRIIITEILATWWKWGKAGELIKYPFDSFMFGWLQLLE